MIKVHKCIFSNFHMIIKILQYFSMLFLWSWSIFLNRLGWKLTVHYRMVARLKILRDGNVEILTDFMKSLSIPNELFLTRCLKILPKCITRFFKENEPWKPQNFKKMLRKSPSSNAWAEILKSAGFTKSSIKVTKLNKF